jgi:hypothetical protein
MPLDLARRFAASMPDARLELIADSHTFTPEDQPEALARHIAAFAGARSAGRGARDRLSFSGASRRMPGYSPRRSERRRL